MGTREKIAEAARNVPIKLGPNAIALAQDGLTIRLSGNEADRVTDAVMEVVEEETRRLTRERDEAREAARTYLHNGAQAITTRAWKQHHMEEDLKLATVFDFGDGITVTLSPSGDDWRVSWPDPDAPGDPARFHPFTEDYPTRDAALARARQLKEEK